MKIRSVLFVVGAALLLAACAVEAYPGRTSVYVPGVSIETEGVHHDHGGGFCPPGQAKKGRC